LAAVGQVESIEATYQKLTLQAQQASFRIARYSPTKPESGPLIGLRQSSLSDSAI